MSIRLCPNLCTRPRPSTPPTTYASPRYTDPEYLSANAKDLLSRMLTVDPLRRVTFDVVMNHPWVKQARWEPPGNFAYMVRVEPTTGAVYADEQLLQVREVIQGLRVVNQRMGCLLCFSRGQTNTGIIHLDPPPLQELEAAGFARAKVLQSLLQSEANSCTAAYYLLAEAKVENSRRGVRGAAAGVRPNTVATGTRY